MENRLSKFALVTFICIVAISFSLHFSPQALSQSVIKPLKTFSIWTNECGRALTAFLLLGWEIESISICEYMSDQNACLSDGNNWERLILVMGGSIGTLLIASLLIIGSSLLRCYCWWLYLFLITIGLISLPLIKEPYNFMIISGYNFFFLLLMVSPWPVIYLILQFLGLELVIDGFFYGGSADLFALSFNEISDFFYSGTSIKEAMVDILPWLGKGALFMIQLFLAVYALKASVLVLSETKTVFPGKRSRIQGHNSQQL